MPEGVEATITTTLTRLAQVLIQVTIVLIILKDFSTVLGFGIWNILILAVFMILYIAIGRLVGGPGLPDRITLVIRTPPRFGTMSRQKYRILFQIRLPLW